MPKGEIRKISGREFNNKIHRALKESGVNIGSLKPVTYEEAWDNVAEPLGWKAFSDAGGLVLISDKKLRRGDDLVGIAFLGPKVPANPSFGKTGAIGIKGGFIGLGDF